MHGDINIFHVCDINEDQMKYGSWAIRRNGEIFWRTTFGPLTLLTQKIKILKKWQNTRAYIILHLCNTNDDHMMHGSWDIKHDRQNFFDILCYSLPFCPTDIMKNQKWKKKKKKKKKMHGDIILHLGTTSDNHVWFLRYGAWQTGLFLTLDHFLPFYPLTTQKIKILKKWKDISSFYTIIPKIMIISYTVP